MGGCFQCDAWYSCAPCRTQLAVGTATVSMIAIIVAALSYQQKKLAQVQNAEKLKENDMAVA